MINFAMNMSLKHVHIMHVTGKCKEKKLVPEVHAALMMILKHCLTFDPLSEDVFEHIKNKKV
jgi:hypothetical protein